MDFIRWRNDQMQNWEIHLGASYSLICVNKTLGELTFGQGESAFFWGGGGGGGETTLKLGRKGLATQLTWGETTCFQNLFGRFYERSLMFSAVSLTEKTPPKLTGTRAGLFLSSTKLAHRKKYP